nr:hypothetical protein [Escherichia coli]
MVITGLVAGTVGEAQQLAGRHSAGAPRTGHTGWGTDAHPG